MARQLYEEGDTPLSLLMDRWPCTIPVFLRYRMLCVGCQVAKFHTVSDACTKYCIDEGQFLQELAAAITTLPRR